VGKKEEKFAYILFLSFWKTRDFLDPLLFSSSFSIRILMRSPVFWGKKRRRRII
jgi:hypothetical protein